MKYLVLLIAMLFTFGKNTTHAENLQPRKKVGLVLSGGGAKGMAHIGAIKVIEEAGIPIDYVVGTSMGAIVGGLYSIGFTTAQIDTLARTQDWKYLLSDASDRKEQSVANRERTEQYVLSVPFDKKPKEALTGGVIKGRNLAVLFSKLTEGYHDSIDFNTLPIPFACVAYNLVNGREVDFHSGVLATAIRASMSIPGAFTPVRLHDMVLVDGGMANNYPVDVARGMGADIVIGVDVQDTLKSASNLNTLSQVVGQIVNLMVENKYYENVQHSDVHIKVDVSGYSSTSFTPVAIDTLLARGEKAARAQWDKLLYVRDSLLLLPPSYAVPVREDRVVSMSDSVPLIASIMPEERKSDNVLRLGVRFDSEKLASLLFNAHVSLSEKRRSLADLTIRLGKTGFGRLDYTFGIDRLQKWQSNVSYQFSYNDIDLYNKGKRISNYSFLRHNAGIAFQRNWHDIRCTLGAAYDLYHFNDMLFSPEMNFPASDAEEYFFSYYYDMYFENYNKRTYPTRGMKWNARIGFYTTDLWRYKGKPAIPIADFSWEAALSPRSRFTVLPAIYGRIVWKENPPYSLYNCVGGPSFARYSAQQLPFMGISYMEMTSSNTVIGSIKLRQRMGSSQYVTFTNNIAFTSRRLQDILRDDHFYGCGLTYGYNSIIGPLEGSIYWSDRTDKVGFLINLGYNF